MSLRARPAAVAGAFYPADPAELLAELRHAFAGARRPEPGPAPKAIVAPHAGYVYSGPVAATAYAALEPACGVVERVVLLGPSHRVPFAGMAVPDVDVLATPFGPMRVDTAGRQAVLDFPWVCRWDVPHAGEHSLEVHLPFLRHVLGEVAVLPVVVGPVPPDQVAEVLDRVWGGPETLIVISSDLSHYHDHQTASRVDRITAQAIEAGRFADIGPMDACGAYPLRGLLVAAHRHGLAGRTVDLRTSADTAGSPDRVVGYGAFVFD